MTSQQSRPVLDDFTVVIPTLGRDPLRRCLHSILASTRWPAEVIVVDQGNNAAVAGWIAELSAAGLRTTHVPSRQTGAAAARNRGFERVTTRFVAGTDDDCLVAPDWLERLAERLRQHPHALVTGCVAMERTDDADGAAPSLIMAADAQMHVRPLLKRDPLFSNNMGFAVGSLERFGLMDEHPTVKHAEDAEWSYRALRAGVPIVYAPEVRVNHLAWRDPAQMAETYRRYARSQGGFYGAYMRRGDWFIATRAAFDLLRTPWFLLRAAVTGDRELAAIGRAYSSQLLPGILAGLARND